jgi:hypothetical protein
MILSKVAWCSDWLRQWCIKLHKYWLELEASLGFDSPRLWMLPKGHTHQTGKSKSAELVSSITKMYQLINNKKKKSHDYMMSWWYWHPPAIIHSKYLITHTSRFYSITIGENWEHLEDMVYPGLPRLVVLHHKSSLSVNFVPLYPLVTEHIFLCRPLTFSSKFSLVYYHPPPS